MTTWLDAAARSLIEVSLEAGLLLSVAFVASALLARGSARGRHALWCIALAATLVAPLLARGLPRYSLAIAPRPFVETSTAAASVQRRDAALRAGARVASPLRFAARPSGTASQAGPGELPVASAPAGALRRTVARRLLAVWALGAMAVLLWQGVALLRVQALTRRARGAADPRHLQRSIAEQRRLVGVRRPVEGLFSDEVAHAFTWGLLRPVLVLSTAAAQWGEERRRLVLQHELWHVRRNDWLVRAMAQVVCAVYWFLPLVWLARRRLFLEQELACDEGVVGLGHRRSDYARHLLALASSLPLAPVGATAAVEMAQRSKVEVRLMSILDPRPRRSRWLLPSLMVVFLLVPTLAAMEPWGPGQRTTEQRESSTESGSLRQTVAELERLAAELEPRRSRLEELERSFEPSGEKLQALEREMEPLMERIRAVELEASSLAGPLELVEEWAEPLSRELEAAELELEPFAERLVRLEAELVPWAKKREELARVLEPYGREMAVLEESIEPLERAVEEAGLRFEQEPEAEESRLRQTLEELHSRLQPLHEQLEQLHRSMEPLHRQLEGVHEQMEPVHRQMEELHRRMEPHLERLEHLHERLRPQHQHLREMEELMEPVHRQLEELHRQMEPYRDQMDDIHRSLEPLHEEMRQLHRAMEPVHRRMDELHRRLEQQLRDEVEAALDGELRAAGAAVADLESLTGRVVDAVRFEMEDGEARIEGSRSRLRRVLGQEIDDSALVERLVDAVLGLRFDLDTR